MQFQVVLHDPYADVHSITIVNIRGLEYNIIYSTTTEYLAIFCP